MGPKETTQRFIGGLPRGAAAAYALIFAVALPFYLWAWPQAPVIEGDSPQYMAVAQDLVDFTPGTLHDRAPGYPLLLVATGAADTPGRSLFVVSLLLHFASIWLLAAALRAAGAGPRLLLVFCAVLLLPPFVEPAAHVMTENLAQFALAAGTSCLLLWLSNGRGTLLALASLAFAWAALTRPTYQALAVALSGCLLLLRMSGGNLPARQLVKAALVLIGGSAVLMGGFAWSNNLRFSYFGVVPTAGIHLSTKTMAFIERLPEEYAQVREILVRERDAELTKRGGTHTGTQTIWAARPELLAATGLSTAELSGFLVRMNLALIARAPIEYLQEVARSLSGYWFPATGALASMGSTPLRWLWAILHLAVVGVFFLQIILIAGVGLHRMVFPMRTSANGLVLAPSSEQTTAYVVAGGIVLYTMLLSCFLDIGEVRQRRPTDVLVVFMCAVGLLVWVGTNRRLRSSDARTLR